MFHTPKIRSWSKESASISVFLDYTPKLGAESFAWDGLLRVFPNFYEIFGSLISGAVKAFH